MHYYCPMKIAILTLGTRGDVQPYAVLGRGLQQRGHELTLSTAQNFESLVLSYGLRFVPVEADFQSVLDSEEGKKMMKANPFAIRRNLKTWVYPLITDSLKVFYALAKESDLVLFHVKTLADTFADQFPEKMVRASVLPIIEPTTAFVNPALGGVPIPRWLYQMSYTLANKSMFLLSSPIKAFRKSFGLLEKYRVPEVRNVYSMSPAFLPMPREYAPTSRFQGFWLEAPASTLDAKLESFLAAGEPPLMITFGSMPFKSKMDIQKAILNLVNTLQIRIIVVRGWGLQDTPQLENRNDVLVIPSAPYDALFPRVRAIVHHGGIGTTAACLHAGKPFFICPVLYPVGDQQFWGKHAQKLGLAVEPCPISKLTETVFNNRVQQLLSQKSLYENAVTMQEKLQKEYGLQATIALLESWNYTQD